MWCVTMVIDFVVIIQYAGHMFWIFGVNKAVEPWTNQHLPAR